MLPGWTRVGDGGTVDRSARTHLAGHYGSTLHDDDGGAGFGNSTLLQFISLIEFKGFKMFTNLLSWKTQLTPMHLSGNLSESFEFILWGWFGKSIWRWYSKQWDQPPQKEAESRGKTFSRLVGLLSSLLLTLSTLLVFTTSKLINRLWNICSIDLTGDSPASTRKPSDEDDNKLSLISWNVDGLDTDNLGERARGLCSFLVL